MKKYQAAIAAAMTAVLAFGSQSAVFAAETTTAAGQQTETTAAAEAETSADEPLVLSDDPYSFELSYGGEVYQFPMTYADFTEKGWVYDGDDTDYLEAWSSYTTLVFKNGDNTAYVEAANFDINALPLSECWIIGIQFDSSMITDTSVEILIPGGFKFGEAMKDDVLAAYGTATSEYAGSMYTEETYTSDTYSEWKIRFDIDTNVLSGVDLENYVEPENFEYGEISTVEPVLNTGYTTPEALTDDPADYIVNLDGDLYQLPAPLTAFEANGWTVNESDSDAWEQGSGSGFVTLTRNNKNISVQVRNYDYNAVPVDYAFVFSFQSDQSNAIPLEIFSGISNTMSETDLTTALGDTEVTIDQSGDYTYYNINPDPESTLDGYQICTTGGSVVSIDIWYMPDLSVVEETYGAAAETETETDAAAETDASTDASTDATTESTTAAAQGAV
ncbi:MAG: hypothetical protein ACOX8B_09605 [Lachnospiraceae bacterium]